MAEIKPPKRYQQDTFSNLKAVRWISVGLIIWAVLLALSSWFTQQGSLLRSTMMVAPAILFVAAWILLVRNKSVT